MSNPYVGAGFDQSIGTRQKAGQTQVEFYNTQNPQQAAFANPGELANYANTLSGRNDINEGNVFDILKQGFTPRATAINSITDGLNAHQDALFNADTAAPKRASSSLTDNIATDQSSVDSALAEFNALKTKLASIQAPNYQQTYNDLSAAQGVPQINTDLAANDKAIRELPYVNRMNSGNAGIQTEGQLGADTTQKGIPLEIQNANLLDRLKLAQSFIDNSLKTKEMDYNASKEGVQNAATLLGQTLQFTRQHLQDLQAKQDEQTKREELAQAFAFDNKITQPFYDVGGTVFRTSDRTPAHNRAEYIAMGGKGDYSDVQKVTPKEDLSKYPASYQEYLLAKKDGFTGNYTDYQNADANRKAKTTGSGEKLTYTQQQEQKQKEDQGKLATFFEQKVGGDQYASPEDYKKAKAAWVADGHTAKDFDNIFSGYVNPADPQDYGINFK